VDFAMTPTTDCGVSRTARALSIVGHPGLLMPLAVALSAAGSGASASRVQASVGAALVVALIVGAFSLWQVRRGHWTHVDASLPRERGQLNVFVALLLFGAALVLALWAGSPQGAGGAALAGAVVALAHLLRRRLKVSLHAAFALFAAALVWPAVPATPLIVALAAGVAWSRLALRRHSLAEVLTGLLFGAAAGALFRLSVG
jgi:membrane-associated phospholipid phosphatase